MHCCQKLALILPLLITVACEKEKTKTEYRYVDAEGSLTENPGCQADLETLCRDVQAQIDAKQVEIKTFSEAGDTVAVYKAQLDLNELMEIRASYQEGKRDVAAITDRYASLRQLLASSEGDVDAMTAITYPKAEMEAVREVFSALGELTIDPALIPAADQKLPLVNYTAAGIPWAAYWYPRRDSSMFGDDAAPLSKLDRWLGTQGKNSKIVDFEDERFDPKAAEWEGLCDAWAMASVMTTEPSRDVTADGITFSPSDLKALAIKYFEGYKAKVHGRRYQGLAETDGLMQDLRPEAFHRIVEEYIGKQKKPIIIDDDPGPEIWSKPVYRYGFSITRDTTKPQALLVKAYPYMTRQREFIDNGTTSLNDRAAPVYEYRLYHDAKPGADGKLKIIAGEWINDSLDSHPDMVFLPQGKENKDQKNDEFRKYNADIRKLLEKAGMMKP